MLNDPRHCEVVGWLCEANTAFSDASIPVYVIFANTFKYLVEPSYSTRRVVTRLDYIKRQITKSKLSLSTIHDSNFFCAVQCGELHPSGTPWR